MNNPKFNIISFFRNLFKKKYTVNLLDSKWRVIKTDIKVEIIPRQEEYIWDGDKYYQVINVVHMFEKKQIISVILELVSKDEVTENQ